MPDYKDTLNLPQTDFPMKANLPEREPAMLAFWAEIDVYGLMKKEGQNRQTFILHDGPPYANGHTHIGHSVNKTLKDIVVKTKTLSGFYSPYVPGWDCHGLPIELNVEKKIGKAGVTVSIEEFQKACRDYAKSQIEIQRNEFKRLGVFGDWDNPYLTMDSHYEANIIRALGKIIENGHLQHGRKPVHWCVDCGSALAEAEVEYKDKESFALDVSFVAKNTSQVCDRFNLKQKIEGDILFPIWTTTPWTLPANEAVALNPSHLYVLLNSGNNTIVVAEELASTAMARLGLEHFQKLATVEGAQLEGLLLQHPFLNRQVPTVLGDHVTLDAGTGLVHTAPAHGQDDYVIGQHYQLPMVNPVNDRGCYFDNVEFFAGQHVFKVNENIIELLKANHKLLHAEKLMHSYPHCWRHKTPLIFRATPQWFVSMEKKSLRNTVLNAASKVEWFPSWGQARMRGYIENRPDWCISRQRVWGTPMPLFVHKETYALHPKTSEIIERVAQAVEKDGIEVWNKMDARSIIGNDAENFVKVTDTLDVWFDSGVSHFCVLDKRTDLQSPADLYLEGSDQHRGWFQTSLLTSVAMKEHAPYKQVLTHGFTVDAEGRKMSKSLGNVIAPEEVIRKYGADVLRLWIASTDYSSEISISDEILKRTSDAYRRIRNTARFLLSNIHDFKWERHHVKANEMLSLDKWAVDIARRLQDEICHDFNHYQFHNVIKKIHQFCSIEMGGFYLDVIKDRLYTCHADSVARRSAQTALYHILEAFVRWLAPVLSFTAEEIWQLMPGQREQSVFLTQWYDKLVEISDDEHQKWTELLQVRDAVNKALEDSRNSGDIGSPLAAEIALFADGKIKSLLQSVKDELRFVLITSGATIDDVSNKPEDAVNSEMEGLWIKVLPSTKTKCTRCWHRSSDVGKHHDHPELCSRCVQNVIGNGEERYYA